MPTPSLGQEQDASGLAPRPALPHIRLMQEIEEKLAHLQKTVDDLSDVIARQDKDITRLREQMDRLILREAERDSDLPGGVVLGDERPPHY